LFADFLLEAVADVLQFDPNLLKPSCRLMHNWLWKLNETYLFIKSMPEAR